MTKADLARAIYQKHGGLTNRQALRIVDVIFDVMRDRLVAGERVRIVGFGSGRRTYVAHDLRFVNPASCRAGVDQVFSPETIVYCRIVTLCAREKVIEQLR